MTQIGAKPWVVPAHRHQSTFDAMSTKKQFGPWETQHGAYCVPFRAVLPSQNLMLGLCGPRLWPCFGSRGPKCNSLDTFPSHKLPLFVVFTPLSGPNRTPQVHYFDISTPEIIKMAKVMGN
uniref:Uncharacterized protein n=1 Tax=Eutreptiella gymnastica TaxID=73025 RepID=A0A7S1J6S0_9EUGL